MVNDLYDAISSNRSKEVLGETLDRFVDYTNYHFEREQHLFSETGYPERAQHCREHSEAAAWVKQMRADYLNGTSTAPSLKTVTFFKDWLFDHILGSDHKFWEFLRARGLR